MSQWTTTGARAGRKSELYIPDDLDMDQKWKC
jgi:hypothetical protein